MRRRPGTLSSVCRMKGRIHRASGPRPTRWRSRTRMLGRSLPSNCPCEPGIRDPGQHHPFVWQGSAVPMSSMHQPRCAAGLSRSRGGGHRRLPRITASRVETHGQTGISRRQIERRGWSASHVSCHSAEPTSAMRMIVQYKQSWAAMPGFATGRMPRRRNSRNEQLYSRTNAGVVVTCPFWTPLMSVSDLQKHHASRDGRCPRRVMEASCRG
jgi:hypothetical protein